ncbi:hypothetical protein RUM44_013744 [Polyplax serrata]|uniref:Uncharacterized protein n=1 Tax=Polyplax serrata TaxID=468196 RepID=A0ABR1BIN5_POLSC
MNEWEHQSIGASYLGPNGSGPDWRSNVGARENVLRKTDERNKNTPYLLKSHKSDGLNSGGSGGGGGGGNDVLHNSRLDFNPGHLKKDDYFKNITERNDFTDKIDFFRGSNFLNSDLYRSKSPNADNYGGRNYPDLYGKPDAKSEYFRQSVAEYYRKNPNDFYFRNEAKSPDYLKTQNSDLFIGRAEGGKRADLPKNGDKSPGLDFLRPKSPKDDPYKQKVESLDFRRKGDGFRKSDTDGDFLKPNCDFGKQPEVYNDKSDYYSEVNNKGNNDYYRKSPEFFRPTDDKNIERCSVISNHSDNSHLSTNSTEISHLRLKINEESDFLPRESAVNGVMNIVNASISGYHAASSSPPISGEMKYIPPGQHHHHHHHHHQENPLRTFLSKWKIFDFVGGLKATDGSAEEEEEYNVEEKLKYSAWKAGELPPPS